MTNREKLEEVLKGNGAEIAKQNGDVILWGYKERNNGETYTAIFKTDGSCENIEGKADGELLEKRKIKQGKGVKNMLLRYAENFRLQNEIK